MVQRLPRQLDSHEVRVLGSLLEKEQATPEYYPLTVKALLAACNQRSNRYPVLELSERDVRRALERLLQMRLVIRDEGVRSTRWSHDVDTRWGVDAAGKAALTVLLLRGAQTTGEVRARTARLYELGSSAAAEAALADLAAPPEPLVTLMEREPGQKEPRWRHRVGAEEVAETRSMPVKLAPAEGRGFDAERMILRIERLEQQVQELQASLRRLRGVTD